MAAAAGGGPPGAASSSAAPTSLSATVWTAGPAATLPGRPPPEPVCAEDMTMLLASVRLHRWARCHLITAQEARALCPRAVRARAAPAPRPPGRDQSVLSPQCSQLLPGQPPRGRLLRLPVRPERDLGPAAGRRVRRQGRLGAAGRRVWRGQPQGARPPARSFSAPAPPLWPASASVSVSPESRRVSLAASSGSPAPSPPAGGEEGGVRRPWESPPPRAEGASWRSPWPSGRAVRLEETQDLSRGRCCGEGVGGRGAALTHPSAPRMSRSRPTRTRSSSCRPSRRRRTGS